MARMLQALKNLEGRLSRPPAEGARSTSRVESKAAAETPSAIGITVAAAEAHEDQSNSSNAGLPSDRIRPKRRPDDPPATLHASLSVPLVQPLTVGEGAIDTALFQPAP